jgi:glyoxylase-like metal-dependent hydrolase (beta-lactamase superfamily II)
MAKQPGELQVHKIPVGPYGENCYLLVDPEAREGVLVDPGAEIDKILSVAEGTKITTIVVTHRHGDHVGALQQARTATLAPVAGHPLDAGAIPGGVQIELNDGDEVRCGRFSLRVIHTPGHTPGSICLLSGKQLIGADTVFPGGPGRTATSQDFEQIVASIREKIYTLPDDTVINTGHGENTTVGESKKEYAVFASKERTEMPCGDVLWLSS